MSPRFLVVIAMFIGLAVCPGVAGDWPHWRGPSRNDISAESSGWDGKDWIERELWTAAVGEGSSSPIVVGGKIFLTGWASNQDTLICLDATSGKELWKQSYPSPKYGRHAIGDQRLYSGACSTPEFDPKTKLLFTLGVDGDLKAWDTTKNGASVWSVNLYDTYKAPRRPEVAV